jgi:hypothetical protein
MCGRTGAGGFVSPCARRRRVMRLNRGGAARDPITDGTHWSPADPAPRPRGAYRAAARRKRRPAGRAVALATDVGTSGGRSLVAASPGCSPGRGDDRARELVWLEARRPGRRVGRGDYWQVRVRPTIAPPRSPARPQLRTRSSCSRWCPARWPPAVLALAADTDPCGRPTAAG